MTQMYETDQLDRTLIVGGHKADLWASDDGYLVTEHQSTNPIEQGLTGTEALELYNELNGTRLQPSFFDMWLSHYHKLAKNPLTGTRVGRDHPAYHQVSTQTLRVREYIRTHPEEVERIRKEHGL